MKKRNSKTVSEINVTSLVDVTFVLLIAFIISAPLLRSGIKVELPKSDSREAQSKQAILITVDHSGQTFINNTKTAFARIGSKVAGILAKSPGLPVLIEGDKKASYGNIITIMNEIREAGIENVGLVLDAAAKK